MRAAQKKRFIAWMPDQVRHDKTMSGPHGVLTYKMRLPRRYDTSVSAPRNDAVGHWHAAELRIFRGRNKMTRTQLIEQLAELIHAVQRPHTVRVAIDGVDASGKTILADELIAPIEAKGRPVIRASIDGFHNPRSVRYRKGPESPEGYYHDSFNNDLLKSSLLIPLGPTGDGQYAQAGFDFRTDTEVASEKTSAPNGAVLLFDGVFLLRPELSGHWDYSLFVEVDFEVSVRRASQRDQHLFGSPDDVRDRYLRRYVPGQEIYLKEVQPTRKADVIVSNNIPEDASIVLQTH